jgi:hypothetical protein
MVCARVLLIDMAPVVYSQTKNGEWLSTTTRPLLATQYFTAL